MNDHTESLEIIGRLRDAVNNLHNMTDDVAKARQVKEFSSERRKNLLALFVTHYYPVRFKSLGAAEHAARTDQEYCKKFEELSEQSEAAERMIAKWQAEQCRYEAARSLLSFSKQVKDELMG